MYTLKLETSCNATAESCCSIGFRLKSAKVEVLGESGREFHNLARKYEKECRP